MASIEKRGEGRYVVRWRDPSGRARARSAPDHRTARALLAEVERAFALGLAWSAPDDGAVDLLADYDRGGKLVGGLFPDYLADRRRVLTASTIKNYDLALCEFLRFLDTQGRPRLTTDLLNREQIHAFDGWNAARGLEPSTRALRARQVLAAWSWAFDHDRIPRRPRDLDLPRVPPTEVTAPTWAEMDRVIAVSTTEWRRRLCVVLRFTGLRVDQAMGLRWEDFDLERATMRVRPELGKTLAERAGRTVPVSRHLVAELTGWGRREGWLVAPAREVRHVETRTMREAWSRAELPEHLWARRPHHAFRRGFVTNLKRDGGDFEAVETLVGHVVQGSRGRYLAAWALQLEATVGLIPPVEAPPVQLRARQRSPYDR